MVVSCSAVFMETSEKQSSKRLEFPLPGRGSNIAMLNVGQPGCITSSAKFTCFGEGKMKVKKPGASPGRFGGGGRGNEGTLCVRGSKRSLYESHQGTLI